MMAPLARPVFCCLAILLWPLFLLVHGFPCDHADLVQLNYFPGLSPETHFTHTKISKAGRGHCFNIFYRDCLHWCAHDKNCMSVHFMWTDKLCACHKCYLMLDELPSPEFVDFGSNCTALGVTAKACMSFACQDKQRQRMVARFGSPFEEVPMLDTRVWMSSIRDDNVVKYGAHFAVDDDVNSFTEHRHRFDYRDDGYHWIMVELPFQTRVTHVTVRPSDFNSRGTDLLDFVPSPDVTAAYFLNWGVHSVPYPAMCVSWVKQDDGIVGALVLLIGKYFPSEVLCVYGRTVDPWMWNSAMGQSKLSANIESRSCKLTVDGKLWKTLSDCLAYKLSNTFYDFPTKNLQGAELLVAFDMPSVPEAVFSTERGRLYEDLNTWRRTEKFHRFVSWKYWTHCGQFSQLLSKTGQGKATVVLLPTCRDQFSLYIAIRSAEPLSIADIEVFQAIGTISTSSTYRQFACSPAQYTGFTPEFLGTYVRPYLINMKHFGQMYTSIKYFADKAIEYNKNCATAVNNLKGGHHLTYIEAWLNRNLPKCTLTKERILRYKESSKNLIKTLRRSFALPSFDPTAANYPLKTIYNLAEAFAQTRGLTMEDMNEVKVKQEWIDLVVKEINPENTLKASLLHELRRSIYTHHVQPGNKLHSTLYTNSQVCFVTCHWANQLAVGIDTAPGVVKNATVVLFEWFMEAFCPNPCANNKCKKVRHSENSQCFPVKGLWKNSYRCLCKPGFVWSPNLHDCLPHNLCSYSRDSGLYPCSSNGTQYCQTLAKSSNDSAFATETQCICRFGYGGKKCDRPADPCTDVNREFKITGQFACAVPDGLGNCSFGSDSSSWICACSSSRDRDLELPYDNCAAHRNSCLSMVCSHGYFISSPNGALCHCQCQPGYDGPSCNVWTGVWSRWSQWDRCRPECGNSRRALSLRRCLNREVLANATQLDYCVGPWQRWQDCDPTSCWLGGDRPLTKSLRLKARYILVSATAASLLATVCATITVICCRYRGYNIGIRPTFDAVYN